jgi:hypothetical protein
LKFDKASQPCRLAFQCHVCIRVSSCRSQYLHITQLEEGGQRVALEEHHWLGPCHLKDLAAGFVPKKRPPAKYLIQAT